MRTFKYIFLFTFLIIYSNSIFSQDQFYQNRVDFRTLQMVDDEFLMDKDLYSFYPKTTPCNCAEDFKFWGDINFGGSNFAVLNALLISEARQKAIIDDASS